jgi:hypothetical protein
MEGRLLLRTRFQGDTSSASLKKCRSTSRTRAKKARKWPDTRMYVHPVDRPELKCRLIGSAFERDFTQNSKDIQSDTTVIRPY